MYQNSQNAVHLWNIVQYPDQQFKVLRWGLECAVEQSTCEDVDDA